MILISVYKEIYEITKFISKHPGEGINSTYLRDYKNKESTEEFEKYHFTNESDEMLINAKKEKFDDETGIYYVCPFFFKNKIPKYFHFLPDDKYGIEYMNNKKSNTFILRPSNSSINNSLSVTYKDDDLKLYQLKIRKIDNVWIALWEDDDGESIDVSEKSVEKIVKKIMIDNGYTGV